MCEQPSPDGKKNVLDINQSEMNKSESFRPSNQSFFKQNTNFDEKIEGDKFNPMTAFKSET